MLQTALAAPLVLDRKESAEVLRISLRSLDYLLERGELRATRIGGRVLISWSELNRFVRGKTVRTKQNNNPTISQS
jgi:excisionase family DNA binding protein